MKNQYVGDIGDYGKYSLLRAFADAGICLGVNWYLTENDGSNDGKFIGYLTDGKLRHLSPEIFDVLKDVAPKPDKSVQDIQDSKIIPGAIYYSDLLKPVGAKVEREYQRVDWFNASVGELADAALIFMDPDNGLLESNQSSKRGAEKYVLPDEVEKYFMKGHNVVYYCHKGRRTYHQWLEYKSIMPRRLPESRSVVLTYHKGSQRSYVFLIHDKDYARYRRIIDIFLSKWDRIFTEEVYDD